MKKITEQDLIDFKRGGSKAFELIFKAYYPSIVIFAKKITGNLDEAQDLASAAFTILYERCDQFEAEHHIKAFLYKCTRNKCLNYLNAEKRHHDLNREYVVYIQDDTLLEYEYSIKEELVAAVRKAIGELPEECRRIFRMLFYEELKPAEIAAILQVSVNTVYVQKARAMEALRLKLDNFKKK